MTNVCFGVSGVLMNAFLPLITAALPEVPRRCTDPYYIVIHSSK